MTRLFVLDADHNLIPEPDVRRWAQWFEDDDNRVVALTPLGQGGHVSTIFLGIGHSLGGPPRLYETMVFDPLGKVLDQGRWTTWTEAQAQHVRIVAKHDRLL